MRFLAVEVVCVALIAVGLGMWVHPGAGLIAAGAFGLPLTVAAEFVARRGARSG